MTPKSLFTIIVKIIGIYVLLSVIKMLPEFLSAASSLLRSGGFEAAFFGFVIIILILGVYVVVLRYLLFKSDEVVERLGLAKNFEEERFEMNMHRSSILKIAMVVIGGITILEYFVPLVIDLYIYIKDHNQTLFGGGDSAAYDSLHYFSGGYVVRVVDLVKGTAMTLAGYLIATNAGAITNFIEKMRRD